MSGVPYKFHVDDKCAVGKIAARRMISMRIPFEPFVSRVVSGFDVTEEVYEAGQALPAHVHSYPHLIVEDPDTMSGKQPRG